MLSPHVQYVLLHCAGDLQMISANESEKFSFYPNSKKQRSSEHIYRVDLANKIREGAWQDEVEIYKGTTKKLAKSNKKSALCLYLPSIYTECARQSSLDQGDFEHTNFIPVSFERQEKKKPDLYDRLGQDPHVGLLYYDIDDNIVALFKTEHIITLSEHEQAYSATIKYCESQNYKKVIGSSSQIADYYKISYDPNCKDKYAESLIYKEKAEPLEKIEDGELSEVTEQDYQALATKPEVEKVEIQEDVRDQLIIDPFETESGNKYIFTDSAYVDAFERKKDVISAWKELTEKRDDPLLYHQEDVICYLQEKQKKTAYDELLPQLVLNPLAKSKIESVLGESVKFYKFKRDRAIKADAPQRLINDLFDSGNEFTPELKRIYRHPVILPSGGYTEKPGYYEEIKAYVECKPQIPWDEIPIDNESVKNAMELISKQYSGFDFENAPSFANTLGFSFIYPLRPIIKGNIPMFVVSAPAYGTGKTFLLDLVHTLWNRNTIPKAILTENQQSGAEETKKSIETFLMEGLWNLCFDNVKREINDTIFGALLTTAELMCRKLGGHQSAALDADIVLSMNGINLEMTEDLRRRIYWARLKVNRMDLSKREFKLPNPDKWILENQDELMAAYFIIIKNWRVKSNKGSNIEFPSFTQFAQLIDQVLIDAGETNFLGYQEEVVDDDLKRNCFLISELFKSIPKDERDENETQPFAISDYMDIISYTDAPEEPSLTGFEDDSDKDESAPLVEDGKNILGSKVYGRTLATRTQSAGKYFRKIVGNVFGYLKLIAVPNEKGAALYKIVEIDENNIDKVKSIPGTQELLPAQVLVESINNLILKHGTEPFSYSHLAYSDKSTANELATYLRCLFMTDSLINGYKVLYTENEQRFQFIKSQFTPPSPPSFSPPTPEPETSVSKSETEEVSEAASSQVTEETTPVIDIPRQEDEAVGDEKYLQEAAKDLFDRYGIAYFKRSRITDTYKNKSDQIIEYLQAAAAENKTLIEIDDEHGYSIIVNEDATKFNFFFQL